MLRNVRAAGHRIVGCSHLTFLSEGQEEPTNNSFVNQTHNNTMSDKENNTMSDKEKPPVFKDVGIKFEGKHIVLPVDEHGRRMPYKVAVQTIAGIEVAEEKIVGVNTTLPSMGWDGAIAFCRAIKEHFGFYNLSDTPTMFGPKPPRMFQVQLADGSFETAIIGRIEPPLLEGGFIECMPGPLQVSITGNVKRKHEDDIKTLLKLTEKYLAEQSIYKGQAIQVDLSWYQEVVRGNIEYDPFKHSPVFIDLSKVDENQLMLKDHTMRQIESKIWLRLKQSEGCVKNGVSLKTGVMLVGPFGTGKTLMAYITAKIAVRNRWSFIYLKPTVDLAMLLKLAEMLGPCVPFAEDISSVVGKERNDAVEVIMNMLDGIDTKGKPLLTIVTTNYPDQIYGGMLRAGRLGTTILFEKPDAATAIRLVKHYAKDASGRDLLDNLSEAEWQRVGQAFDGIIPAFINDALENAKLFAMSRIYNDGGDGSNILGKITADDLVNAAIESEEQRRMCEEKEPVTEEQLDSLALRHFGHVIKHRSEPLALENNGEGQVIANK